LALFCLATVLATFQKIGRFFPNHLVTLVGAQKPLSPNCRSAECFGAGVRVDELIGDQEVTISFIALHSGK
jgi:hypothetical protein